LTSHLILHLYLSSIGWASDALGQAHMTLWHPLLWHGCLLMGGLVILSISFAVWPS
jgi:hypothetical protein